MFLFALIFSFAHGAATDCTTRVGHDDGKAAVTNAECTTSEKYLAGYRIGRKSRVLQGAIFSTRQSLEITLKRQEKLRYEITPAQIDLELGGYYTKAQVAADYAKETSDIAQFEIHQKELRELAQRIDREWDQRETLIESYQKKWGRSEVDVDRSWKQTLADVGGFSNLKPSSKTAMQAEIKSTAVMGQALAAIVIGFGTGHALQDRYWQTGWKYTLWDTTAVALLFAGRGGNGATNALGLVTLVFTRVFQGADVLENPAPSASDIERLKTNREIPSAGDLASISIPLYQIQF